MSYFEGNSALLTSPRRGYLGAKELTMDHQWTVVFPLYPMVTHLDFTGPHQFLARLPGARLVAASVDARPMGADGLVFSDLADLEAIEHADILCVPGGSGCTQAVEDVRF